MSYAYDKPIFDALRAVCGPLDQGEVDAAKIAIHDAEEAGSDRPIFEFARANDDDEFGLSQFEVDTINRALAAAKLGRPLSKVAPRQVGAKGLAIVKAHEGLELTAYLCPAKVWTIGYGHTGPDVRPRLTIDGREAERLLDLDLDIAEQAVAKAAPGASQEQFDAMVSLAFNIGVGAFLGSTLLKRHKAGDFAGAASAFGSWVYAKRKKLPGLVRRRGEEAALYRSGS